MVVVVFKKTFPLHAFDQQLSRYSLQYLFKNTPHMLHKLVFIVQHITKLLQKCNDYKVPKWSV